MPMIENSATIYDVGDDGIVGAHGGDIQTKDVGMHDLASMGEK